MLASFLQLYQFALAPRCHSLHTHQMSFYITNLTDKKATRTLKKLKPIQIQQIWGALILHIACNWFIMECFSPSTQVSLCRRLLLYFTVSWGSWWLLVLLNVISRWDGFKLELMNWSPGRPVLPCSRWQRAGFEEMENYPWQKARSQVLKKC